jgi:Spy/CpxP family protein refolding chaperone
MKKLILVALLAASLSGFAQEAGKKGGANKMLQKMTTELSLTADQQAAISPIVEEQVALKKDSKENPDHADANKVKVKELSKKIKGMLTPEQLEIQKAGMELSKGEGKEGKKEGKEGKKGKKGGDE